MLSHDEMRRLADCGNCPLYPEHHNPCFGSGPGDAQLVVIGTAPGRNEAEQGTPFIGQTGWLLDATLKEAGHSREHTYVTNSILCAPPDGTSDSVLAEAAAACRKRLVAEVGAVRPRAILAMGAQSAQSVLDTNTKISQLVGANEWSSEFEATVIPTYHPASVLHGNVGNFDEILNATKRAVKFARGELDPPDPDFTVPYEYYTEKLEIGQVLDEIWAQGGLWAIDTESDGLDPYTDDWLLTQFSNGQRNIAIEMFPVLSDPDLREKYRRLMRSRTHTWIWHNVAYDHQVLQHYLGVESRHFEDTMALGLCLTEHLHQVGLEYLARQWCNAPTWKQDIGQYLKTKNTPFSAIPREKMVPYGATDTYYTYKLWHVLVPLVREEGTWELYEKLLKPAQAAFAKLELHGTYVDQSYIEQLHKEWDGRIEEARRALQEFARSHGFDATKINKGPCEPDLNPNAAKQLQHLFYDIMGLKGPGGRRTCDKDFIKMYRDRIPEVRMLEEYRTARHMLSTYVDGIADDINPVTQRVHPRFLLGGTVTGRLSIQDPPLQTIPREELVEEKGFDSIKRLFAAPKGYVIADVDYSNLELHVAHHLTGDDNLGLALKTQDFHRATASAVFDVPYDEVTPQQRYLTKFITFGLAYGRQAWSLKDDLGTTEEEAQRYIDLFWERYPDYHRWWVAQQQQALETGRLVNAFGRVRRWNLITPDLENHIKNQAVNFPIQSTASDLCVMAATKLVNILPERDLGHPLFMVHDSVIFELREDRLDESLPIIKEVMETPPFETKAEFPVDIKVGPNWGNVKEVDL